MSIITTDMAKAKEIHKTNIRYARTPKLAELILNFKHLKQVLIHQRLLQRNKQEMHRSPLVFQSASGTDLNRIQPI